MSEPNAELETAESGSTETAPVQNLAERTQAELITSIQATKEANIANLSPDDMRTLGYVEDRILKGNLEGAQAEIEKSNTSSEALRALVGEINQTQALVEGRPVPKLDGAAALIDKYGKNLREQGVQSGDRTDIADGSEVSSLVRGLSRPGGATELREYVDGVLASMAAAREVRQLSSEELTMVRDYRDARGALLREEQRLDATDNARRQAAAEKLQREPSVAAARRQIDSLVTEATETDEKLQPPADRRGLTMYSRENFSSFDSAKLDQFKAFLDARVDLLLREHAEAGISGRYPDTVAAVLDQGSESTVFLAKAINENLPPNQQITDENFYELLRQPFSQVANQYLGMDMVKTHPGYFDTFSPR